jgi:putative oxidoreductase
MYLTGALEIACAVLVLIPRFAGIGAALLVCTMIGAIFSLLGHGLAAMVAPPVVLLILAFALGQLRGWSRGSLTPVAA